MAAPAFVQASLGISDIGGTWGTGLLMLSNMTVGNFLVLHVLQDGTTAGAVDVGTGGSSAIEDLAGTAGTMTLVAEIAASFSLRHYIWVGRVASASTNCEPSGTNSTSEDVFARMYEFSGVATGTTLADVLEQNGTTTPSSLNGTGATISDAGVTTTGADRLALNFVAINDDNAVDAFTGMTGGTWAEAVAEYASATGTDGCIQLQTATMASAGTIDGGSYTMAVADGWGAAGFALIPPTSGLTASPAGLASASSLGSVTIVPGNTTQTVTGLASASSFGSPTMAPGNVDVSATGLASASSLGAVTINQTTNVAVSGLASASSVGSPTLVPGAVTQAVSGLASASSLGSPTFATGNVDVSVTGLASASSFGTGQINQTLSPLAGLASASSLGTVTITTGNVDVAATGLASASSLGAPTLAPGNVNLTVSGLASASSLGAPDVTAGGSNQTVNPAGLASAQAFGAIQTNVEFPITGLASASQLGAPTVSPGAVTTSVTGLASASSLGAVSIAAGGTVVPVTGLASVSQLGTSTVVPGPATAAPAGLASASTFGAVTFSVGPTTVAVTGLDSGSSFGNPTLNGGVPDTFNPAALGGGYFR